MNPSHWLSSKAVSRATFLVRKGFPIGNSLSSNKDSIGDSIGDSRRKRGDSIGNPLGSKFPRRRKDEKGGHICM